jgi:mRNA-degrading endonuclease toxin of MazEF toxin-antitoxin module
MLRGDVVLLHFPFSSGAGSKVRPAVVIQSNLNNRRLKSSIVAMIGSALRHSHEPTQLVIDPNDPDGKSSGLLLVSAVKCENLFTIDQSLVHRRIGALHPNLMDGVDNCLRESLSLT